MRVNRTYPTIVGWSAELARKRVREENKAGSFGRGTVLPRISKPADIAAATSGQTDQPPVAALNIPSSSVDKVAGILQKLASTVGEFGEAIAEIGKQGAPVTDLKEYLALGSSALFWKVDELTEEVVDMSWKESENYIDCGLFVMRHMETYKGTLKKWNPGFKKKAKLNEEFLIGLRARYAATIIKWSANILKNVVIKKTKLLYNKK
nr:uncharacterized protein LOC109158392 [Ipomoea batatas]